MFFEAEDRDIGSLAKLILRAPGNIVKLDAVPGQCHQRRSLSGVGERSLQDLVMTDVVLQVFPAYGPTFFPEFLK